MTETITFEDLSKHHKKVQDLVVKGEELNERISAIMSLRSLAIDRMLVLEVSMRYYDRYVEGGRERSASYLHAETVKKQIEEYEKEIFDICDEYWEMEKGVLSGKQA